MKTNRDILENGYWSSSSSGSIRSEFDEDYYKMKPPPPKFQDYKEKILVIKEGQFSQSEAQLQNVPLSNTSSIQSNVHQIPNLNTETASSSKSSNNINSPKVFNNATGRNENRRNFVRGNSRVSRTNFTNKNNAGNSSESTGAVSKINVNNTEPHRYPTPWNSITRNNANFKDSVQDRWNETKQLPSQDNTRTNLSIQAHSSHNVHLPIHSISVDRTSSITGRCNMPSRKIKTAQKPILRSSYNSNTYRTFSAAPQIVSTNAIQIHQPTSVRTSERVTKENTNENCCSQICCCWFKCCL